MQRQEMISRIATAEKAIRQVSPSIVQVLRELNNYNTSDEIIAKNMELADSMMKVINDSQALQKLLKEEELV